VSTITPESLGSPAFRRDYGVRYAYLGGAMYKGIASAQLVIALGKAGMLGYFGTGGLELAQIEAALHDIQAALPNGQPYGMNLLSNPERPELEERTVDLFLQRGVRNIEAAAYLGMTPALVSWRVKGLKRGMDGRVERPRRILAKVSRPEVATAFLEPPPAAILGGLVAAGKITAAEAELAGTLPMADDICVEADSGGHTDQGVAYTLMPLMLGLRDELTAKFGYGRLVRVGAAGGIGTPHAAAAAFVIGADFILTGSINQCTVEAGTSAAVKDLLQELDVHDTEYAPAGDMFELGARVQVAKRGLFFAARANRLYELYQRHRCLEEIDGPTRKQIEERYFKRTFEQVWEETRAHYLEMRPGKLAHIERNPKRKMAAVFRWYFAHTTRLALSGSEDQKVDYQIHCGPALGAFNRWVKGTELQSWRRRHVADIGGKIMTGAAALLNARFDSMCVHEPRTLVA
jgi:trans-AT polyketide synthase/acyltransferase/oxidoreductase domain-containing protein